MCHRTTVPILLYGVKSMSVYFVLGSNHKGVIREFMSMIGFGFDWKRASNSNKVSANYVLVFILFHLILFFSYPTIGLDFDDVLQME